MNAAAAACLSPVASRRGFTLVELILVMALLVVFMGIIVPDVSRSLRARNLEAEAARLLALTEYTRDEAVGQGVPMTLWIDTATGAFGTEPKAGYTAIGGGARTKSYRLNENTHFDPIEGGVVATPGAVAATVSPTDAAPATGQPAHGGITAVEFSPDGTLNPASIAAARLSNRKNEGISLALTADGYGYAIVRDTATP